MAEIRTIKEKIEARHKIKLPEIDVLYSENIDYPFCVDITYLPEKTPHERRSEIYRRRDLDLRAKGLKYEEIKRINPSKATICIPKRYQDDPTELAAAYWEELGHIAANALGIEPITEEKMIANEAIALAYRFKGLLLEAREGRFPLEKAIEQIEEDIERVKSPFAHFTHYGKALDLIRRYDPDLEFRNRDPDELIKELDKSISYIIPYSVKIKLHVKKVKDKIKSKLR